MELKRFSALLITLFCTFTLAMLGISSNAYSAIYYVQTDGNDSNLGDTWGAANALLTIGQALSMASGTPEADTIRVAAGTYNEWDLALVSDLILYGGYPAAGGGEETRDPATHITTIDGNSNATVIYCSGISNVTIDGFTVTNGLGNHGSDPHHGGGFYIETCTNLTISNNQITNNIADRTVSEHDDYDVGGGLFVDGGCDNSVEIIWNEISFNRNKKNK